MIPTGIEALARLQDHDGPVQPRGKLLEVVEMRVIDEGASARQEKMRRTRIARSYERSQLLPLTTPSGNPVGVTQQLHSVPVNRGRFAEPVGDDDVGRLSSSKHQHRSGDLHRVGLRGLSTSLQDESECPLPAIPLLALIYVEMQAAR